MTVCIAAICRWVYDSEGRDIGWAIVTASDRMVTNGDVEYEPPQRKMSVFGQRIALLAAGEIQVHSEAIKATGRQLLSCPETDVRAVAEIYASHIRDLRKRWAAQTYLSPLGLDETTFLQKQKEMSPEIVADLFEKIQRYSFDIQAIIAGINENGEPEICNIDGYGMSAIQTDIGFVSIGIGAGHANFQLMASGYAKHANNYCSTMGLVYAAKKRAEMAPGVGGATDILLINKLGIDFIEEDVKKILDEVYKEWVSEIDSLTKNSFRKIAERTAFLIRDGAERAEENKSEDLKGVGESDA